MIQFGKFIKDTISFLLTLNGFRQCRIKTWFPFPPCCTSVFVNVPIPGVHVGHRPGTTGCRNGASLVLTATLSVSRCPKERPKAGWPVPSQLATSALDRFISAAFLCMKQLNRLAFVYTLSKWVTSLWLLLHWKPGFSASFTAGLLMGFFYIMLKPVIYMVLLGFFLL